MKAFYIAEADCDKTVMAFFVFVFIQGGFGMHMADALLSVPVGGAFCVLSAGTIAYAVRKTNENRFFEQNTAKTAIAGAFVFAAQMLNFAIPGTGASGHIGGGILLSSVLGGFPALIAMSAVLVIQCLFFADGGLLALGCNLWNLGVLPCLVAYPLFFKLMCKKGLSVFRITAAAVVATVVGLQLGSLGVVLETQASGITRLPFAAFALLMQPMHLAIGLMEGLITAAVLCFLYKTRPEILASSAAQTEPKAGMRRGTVLAGIAAVIVTAGVLSGFASTDPDGLEWAIEKTAGSALSAPEKDGYEMPAAGLAGAALTFCAAAGTGVLITGVKKMRHKEPLKGEGRTA